MSEGRRVPREVRVVICGVAASLLAGCAGQQAAHYPPPGRRLAAPTTRGSYHLVQPGETLWRIARSFGLDVAGLASANRLSDVNQLKVGQRLLIPPPTESNRFFWPVRGRLTRSSSSGGVAIAAVPGSLVRASRSGLVAVATDRLAGWGKTVVLDHRDGYYSVYAGLEQVLAEPAGAVRQGMALGRIGTGALHFEIRYGTRLRDTLALLPEP